MLQWQTIHEHIVAHKQTSSSVLIVHEQEVSQN